MPRETFEQEVWDLYTYFLNTFNTRLKHEDKVFAELKKAIYDTAEQCIIFMDVHRYFFLQSIKSLLQVAFSDDDVDIVCGQSEEVTEIRSEEGACGR